MSDNDILNDVSEEELKEALVFLRNFKKAGPSLNDATMREHPCNSNCDCYIELELLQAAGIGGYRYGS